MTIFQITSNFDRIAAIPGCNSYGGPGFRQLAAIAELPSAERAAVLSAFANEVYFAMSPTERLSIDSALTLQPACA